MAAGVRIELTSSLLESEVLAFERTRIMCFSCRSVPTVKRLSALPAELLAGKVNYDITTYGLTDRCSASELHSHVNTSRRIFES